MGQTATQKLLVELKKDVVPARVAEDRAGLFHAMTETGEFRDLLPYYGEILVGHTVDPMWVSDYRLPTDQPPHTNPEEQKFGRIPNPVVHLALNQIRKTVNAVLKKYGLPESIHIELARELNKSAEARDEIAYQNKKNKAVNDEAAEMLAKISVKVDRLNIQKYKLWKEQGCTCIYTGASLSLDDLFNGEVDVDHILPRSITFSDSMANKVVCKRSAKADKSNQPPYKAFADNPDYDWEAVMRRVEKLSANKQWRFEADAMKRFEEDPESFRARYGSDNSYIARVARQYLACLYGEQHKVVAVSSYIIAMLRGKWGLNKILGGEDSGKKLRDDHRHHFVDALVAACATRGVIQRIQREAARCERQKLDAFVEKIAPPFGTPKEFFNAARMATLERVSLSRKPDHAKASQLHEDTLMGIIDGPDKNGSYVCRKRKKLSDYSLMKDLEKAKISAAMTSHPEIDQAMQDLEAIKSSIKKITAQATEELTEEHRIDIASGKKGKNISDRAIYSRAVQLHIGAGGKRDFTLYEKQKLVNIRRAADGNRPTGGYISGRNHRMDFYLDPEGKVRWQVISMMDANDKHFVSEASKSGNRLLWSAHKDDLLEMDDPGDNERRIRVVVAKFRDVRMGVVPETDARDSKERVLWEKGLSFFQKAETQRVVTDALGDVTWRFPALPRPEQTQDG
jgi:CRISPR-associated endonuclease Csn1